MQAEVAYNYGGGLNRCPFRSKRLPGLRPSPRPSLSSAEHLQPSSRGRRSADALGVRVGNFQSRGLRGCAGSLRKPSPYDGADWQTLACAVLWSTRSVTVRKQEDRAAFTSHNRLSLHFSCLSLGAYLLRFCVAWIGQASFLLSGFRCVFRREGSSRTQDQKHNTIIHHV